ncbi:hypothetical protein L218DRAFT_949904 [Marasmius fiardii PR-910]|nr:hypothetical protein L218DRAFT_949904 [Marasmius fiardii PR-910]
MFILAQLVLARLVGAQGLVVYVERLEKGSVIQSDSKIGGEKIDCSFHTHFSYIRDNGLSENRENEKQVKVKRKEASKRLFISSLTNGVELSFHPQTCKLFSMPAALDSTQDGPQHPWRITNEVDEVSKRRTCNEVFGSDSREVGRNP